MNLAKKGMIISVKEIAKRTIEVAIKVPDDFNFIAGQYIWLMIPELKYPDPKGNTRMFSIASSPNKKGEVDLVFRTGVSGYKKTLVEMSPGTEVNFSGPYGNLKLPEDNFMPMVFVAGGVGIAPLLSMIRFSNETNSGHIITLIYANINKEEAVYIDELVRLERKNTNLKLVNVFGLVKEETFNEFIGHKTVWTVLGSKDFVAYVQNYLTDNGVFYEDVIFEEFYSTSTSTSTFVDLLASERLGISKHPYELAVESSNNHIIITDIDGYILYANKAAQELTGYTLQEMNGNTSRLWGGLMPLDFYKRLWKTIKYDRQPFIGEVRNRRKNQDEYDVILHISPIINEKNDLVGFVATEEDVTKLKESERKKTEFVSIASHQLRTPISALNWLTEALQFNSQNLNPKQLVYVKDLSTQAKRLIGLIEDLLDFSRIELKTALQEKHQIDISIFINKFVKEMEPYATSKKHTIILNVKIARPLIIEINEKSLYNMFQNLVSNAIDYSLENTEVNVNLEKVDGFIKASVSNKGSVIPDDEKPRIFEKFYRGESVRKMKQEGTGLGLYVVKTVAEELGGNVGFESEEGKDTMFWFTIPLKLINKTK